MPKRPNVRHLERLALKAIAARLGQPAPQALRAVERDGQDVILRLNSSGYAIAVESDLGFHGYEVTWDDQGNPDNYGVALRVHGGKG